MIYAELVVLAGITLGYVYMASIAATVTLADQAHGIFFLVGGSYGLFSLWWLLVACVIPVKDGKIRRLPWLIWVGLGAGFALGAYLVADGFVHTQVRVPVAPVLLIVALLYAFAIHGIVTLRRGATRKRSFLINHSKIT
jgi:hypothetical protein